MSKHLKKLLGMSREVRATLLVIVLAIAGICALAYGAPRIGAASLVLAGMVGVGFWILVIRPARIPRDAVLMLRFEEPLHEDVRYSLVDQLLRRGAPGLRQVRDGLEAAVTDRKIRAVVVEIAGLAAGLATAHEVHRLLRAIRSAGKRVIALITTDSVGLREYLVAAGADEIVINPDAMLTMVGVAIGNPFLREGLERIGIRAQTLQWKEYKGAAEMLSRDSMSPEVRESLDAIVHDWEKILIEAIAEARRITPEKSRELINAGFLGATAAREAGLVDRSGYLEEVRAEFDPKGAGKCFISLSRYGRHVGFTRDRGQRPQIALVQGVGPVVAGEPSMGGEFISGDSTARQIDRASRDEGTRAIVFRVNSPGGSAVGSELVWRAVRQARERGKPVIVSMGDVAGSGGYYVAMGADAIVAEPATITGSIGVVYAKLDLSKMLAAIGVRFDFVKSGAAGDALSISRAMTEPELAQLNAAIGEVYGNFTAKVAEGRKLAGDATEMIARGRVWSGLAAKRLGLVDELGGFSRAVEIARERAQIPPHQAHKLVSFSSHSGLLPLRQLAWPSSSPPASDLLPAALGLPTRWAPALLRLLMRGGTLLFCPFWDL